MRYSVVIVAGLLLTACNEAVPSSSTSGGAGDPSTRPSGASDVYTDHGKQFAWNEAGKEAIKSKLKDPDSAQFRNVNFYSGSGKPITCGEVNAKNSFGGYGGYERFIAAGDVITVLESEMEAGAMDETWQMFCK